MTINNQSIINNTIK